MIIAPETVSKRDLYKLTIGSVLPRPIAWVSSRDGEGYLNLAPYSFFTVASTDPLTLIFCPQALGPNKKKDTLRNIESVGEFVVNIVTEETAAAMNETASLLPAAQSEFEYAGLTPAPSTAVSVPRVAESPVAFECRLHQIVYIGDDATVFGAVQSIYIRDDVYENGYILIDRLKPIGRLAGDSYVRVTDIFDLVRNRVDQRG